VGSDLFHVHLHGLRPPTTSVLTAAGLWQQSIPRCGGVVTYCWCDSRGGYPPSLGGRGGGFLRQINTFRRLPRPLCWVLVRGPSECYPVACYCVHRPVLGGSRLFYRSKGRRYIGIFVGCGLHLPARRRS
jgi:hypothetical protein